MLARHSFLFATALLGCAASAPQRTPRSVPAAELPEGPVTVRYNPARCPCPTWEARVAGSWERVHVEDASGDGGYVAALVDRAEEDDRSDVDGRYEVAAELSGGTHRYRDGYRYRVLVIEGDPEPVEEDEPDAQGGALGGERPPAAAEGSAGQADAAGEDPSGPAEPNE